MKKKSKGRGGWRKGAGRKATIGDNTQVAIRLDDETLEQLDAMTIIGGNTRSEIIRALIRQGHETILHDDYAQRLIDNPGWLKKIEKITKSGAVDR